MENFLKTDEDKAIFLDAILSPAPPNQALIEARLRYKELVESGEIIIRDEVTIKCDCDTTDPFIKSSVERVNDFLDEQGLPKLTTGLPKEKTLRIKRDGLAD